MSWVARVHEGQGVMAEGAAILLNELGAGGGGRRQCEGEEEESDWDVECRAERTSCYRGRWTQYDEVMPVH